jgi:hypothetical protein
MSGEERQMEKRQKTIRIGAGAGACALLAALLSYLSFPNGKSANASPVPELLSALPPGAPTLVYVDLAAVRASSFYQHRPDKSPIAIPSPDYADFVRATGFNFENDLDRVAIASWPSPSAKERRRDVVIAEGRFDRAKIRDYAASKGKIERQQGRDIFLFDAGDRMRAESMTFLDDHRLAFVAGPSIEPLFPAASGSAAADPARERAARVDGAAAFMITPMPPIPENAGSPQTAQFMSLARSVQWITVAARPEGDDLRVSLDGECDNSSDAQQLKSMLEVLRMFGRAGLENPKTTQSMNPASLAMAQSLLTSAEVTQSAERVRILLEVTPDIFKLADTQKPQSH